MSRNRILIAVVAMLWAAVGWPPTVRAEPEDPVRHFFIGGQFVAVWECDFRLVPRDRLWIDFRVPPKQPRFDKDHDLCCNCYWADVEGNPPGSGRLTAFLDPRVELPSGLAWDLSRKKAAIRGNRGYAQRCWEEPGPNLTWNEILQEAAGEPLMFSIESWGKGQVREGDITGCYCEFAELDL